MSKNMSLCIYLEAGGWASKRANKSKAAINQSHRNGIEYSKDHNLATHTAKYSETEAHIKPS